MYNPMQTLELARKIGEAMNDHDAKTSVTALAMCLAFIFNEIDTDAEKKQAREYMDEVIDQGAKVIEASQSRWGAFLKRLMAA
jgi:hypothetical protein